MSAQNGRDMLVKIKKSDQSYETVAGLRTKALRLNARPVDVTDSESAEGWKELLPHAGIKSAEISGTGIFKTSESAGLLRSAFFDQSVTALQFILPGFGQIEGDFLVTALSFTGNYQGEAGVEMTVMSAGQPVFTAI